MRSIQLGFAFILILVISVASASEVILIKSPGCQKCAAAARVIDGIMAEDHNITFTSYDYFSVEGHRIIKERNAKEVPSVIIGQRVIGYQEYGGDNVKMEQLIRGALENQSLWGDSQNIASSSSNDTQIINQSPDQNAEQHILRNNVELNLHELSFYTVSAVLIAGLFAGFNPCLLGILVFLAASVVSTSGRRKEMIMMVLFFSFGIFMMYFLFGLGMQRLLQTEAVAAAFRYILTVFLMVIGLVNILDAVRLNTGNESVFRTDWALKYFQTGVSNKRLSSYFLIGALFSLVKAPCVGAIYLAILDLLSTQSYLQGGIYLIFFNLGVIMPIIVLGGFIALGMSPNEVDTFRKDHRVGMRLITGFTLLALAPMIYWQMI